MIRLGSPLLRFEPNLVKNYHAQNECKIMKLVTFEAPKCTKTNLFGNYATDSAGGAYSAPPDHLAGGEGGSLPLPKNLAPALGPSLTNTPGVDEVLLSLRSFISHCLDQESHTIVPAKISLQQYQTFYEAYCYRRRT